LPLPGQIKARQFFLQVCQPTTALHVLEITDQQRGQVVTHGRIVQGCPQGRRRVLDPAFACVVIYQNS